VCFSFSITSSIGGGFCCLKIKKDNKYMIKLVKKRTIPAYIPGKILIRMIILRIILEIIEGLY